MKSHVWRPLFVVCAVVVLMFIIRAFYVPKDFGVHERGYMYGWYREGNIEDWRKFQVKYLGKEYCRDCHPEKLEMIEKTFHGIIQCENCHGPAIEHPSNPPKLAIDKSREQCLRCHYPLIYPSSGRANIRGIDPGEHHPDKTCVECHNPHQPTLRKRK